MITARFKSSCLASLLIKLWHGRLTQNMGSRENVPVTRHQVAQEAKRQKVKTQMKELEKRRATLFQSRKIIGPRDILVNTEAKKIKIEGPEDEELKPTTTTGNGNDLPHSVVDALSNVDVKVEVVEPLEIHFVKEEVDVPLDYDIGDILFHDMPPGSTSSSHPEDEFLEEAILLKVEATDGTNPQHEGSPCPEAVDVKPATQDLDVANKVIILFPQVVEVYWVKFAKSNKNGRELLNLNCRLTCKAWKSGMDAVLTSDSSPVQILTKIRIENGNPEYVEQQLGNWISRYNDKSGFPDFQRQELVIEDMYDNQNLDMSTCGTLILKFLQQFGGGIQKFTYISVDNRWQPEHDVSFEDVYTNLREWVLLMPNIKSLEISSNKHYYNWRFLPEFGRLYPFPRLEQLEYFSTENHQILRLVLTENNHIIKFKSDSLFDYHVGNLYLPKLVDLNFNVKSWRCDDSDMVKLVSMKSELLQALTIRIHYFMPTYPEFIKLADAIATLKNLTRLRILNLLEWKHSSRLISWPQLKELEISLSAQHRRKWSDRGMLNFVSRLMSLEKFVISDFSWLRKYERLQAKRRLNTEFVSKLWNLLPKLKLVQFKIVKSDCEMFFIRPITI